MFKNANLKIILADDDEDDQLILSSVFRQNSPDVQLICVGNGQELIEFLEQPHQQFPSLILLDVNMPFMNGFETLRYLKASDQLCYIPVILLTTSAEPEHINMGYQLGAKGFLTKPSNGSGLRELASTIGNFCQEQAH